MYLQQIGKIPLLSYDEEMAVAREIKENTNYYILKKTELPSALVECGFLSNTEEEQKLNTEEYQQKES